MSFEMRLKAAGFPPTPEGLTQLATAYQKLTRYEYVASPSTEKENLAKAHATIGELTKTIAALKEEVARLRGRESKLVEENKEIRDRVSQLATAASDERQKVIRLCDAFIAYFTPDE